MNYSRKKHNLGISLVEALLAAAVLSIAAAAVALPFSSGALNQHYGRQQELATQLAQSMLAEIAAANFSQIIANYNGYSEAAGAICDSSGTIITDPAYSKFSRTVSCAYYNVPQITGNNSQLYIRSIVSVSYDNKPIMQLTAMRTQ